MRFNLAILILLPLSLVAQTYTERIGIEPALHGVWTLRGLSLDRGETIDWSSQGAQMAHVYPGSVMVVGETARWAVSSVGVYTEGDGTVVHAISFKRGPIWFVSRPNKDMPYMVLVRVVPPNGDAEQCRFIALVDH